MANEKLLQIINSTENGAFELYRSDDPDYPVITVISVEGKRARHDLTREQARKLAQSLLEAANSAKPVKAQAETKSVVNDLERRAKRGKLISEMGLVSRDESGFTIKSPTRDRKLYRVWRDSRGAVQCDCAEFVTEFNADPRYRCEHILAVKYFLEG